MAVPYSACRNDTAQHPDFLISATDQAEQTSNAPTFISAKDHPLAERPYISAGDFTDQTVIT